MKVCFRVDASIQMGSGHVMRCLCLAEALKKQGADIVFIARSLPGNLNAVITQKGFCLESLPYVPDQINHSELAHAAWLGDSWELDAMQTIEILEKAGPFDWMVMDHYALASRWQFLIRPYIDKLMVIDDLADRVHDCDLLLDQNLFPDLETRYQQLVPQSCKQLLGPQYALLREEFRVARETLRERDGHIRRILVFFGAADPLQLTLKAMDSIRALNKSELIVDVVVGKANPLLDAVKNKCEEYGFHFYAQVDNMAQLMAQADLAIGAGGTTTWERCCLGLPSVVSVVAQNQQASVSFLVEEKLVFSCETNGYEGALLECLTYLLSRPQPVKECGSLGTIIVADNGSYKVVETMILIGEA